MKNFWNKVDQANGCWLWTGCRTNGYGRLRVAGRLMLAHRVSFHLHNGFLPVVVMHKCDVRACVRPDHLAAGDYRTNWLDALAKGRAKVSTGRRFKRGNIPANRALTQLEIVRTRELVRHRAGSLVALSTSSGIALHILKDLSSKRTY